MSGDLISRRAVIELIESCHVLEDAYCLVDFINELPTAYDVDKVVSDIDNTVPGITNMQIMMIQDIVKSGGTD